MKIPPRKPPTPVASSSKARGAGKKAPAAKPGYADKSAFDLLTGSPDYRQAFRSDKALMDVYQAREVRVRNLIDRRRDVLIYK